MAVTEMSITVETDRTDSFFIKLLLLPHFLADSPSSDFEGKTPGFPWPCLPALQ
jgi:hypothetical protein